MNNKHSRIKNLKNILRRGVLIELYLLIKGKYIPFNLNATFFYGYFCSFIIIICNSFLNPLDLLFLFPLFCFSISHFCSLFFQDLSLDSLWNFSRYPLEFLSFFLLQLWRHSFYRMKQNQKVIKPQCFPKVRWLCKILSLSLFYKLPLKVEVSSFFFVTLLMESQQEKATSKLALI